MKTYEVTIKGTVIKTLTIEADSHDAAVEAAHQEFTAANDGEPEKYSEEVVNVKETKS